MSLECGMRHVAYPWMMAFPFFGGFNDQYCARQRDLRVLNRGPLTGLPFATDGKPKKFGANRAATVASKKR